MEAEHRHLSHQARHRKPSEHWTRWKRQQKWYPSIIRGGSDTAKNSSGMRYNMKKANANATSAT